MGKIIFYAVIILIVALVVKNEYPQIYEDTFGRAADYGMAAWNEKKRDYTENMNFNEVTGEGELDSPKPGTIYGFPFDTANFPCKYDEQCQVRFSVTSVCDVESGNCYEGIIP